MRWPARLGRRPATVTAPRAADSAHGPGIALPSCWPRSRRPRSATTSSPCCAPSSAPAAIAAPRPGHPPRRRADPPGAGGRRSAFAPSTLAYVRAGQRGPPAAHRRVLPRAARPQRAAAPPPDRVRARSPAQRRRSDARALPRRLPPPHPDPFLPRLGRRPAHGQPRPAGKRPLRDLRRRAAGHRLAGGARSRRAFPTARSSTSPAASPARRGTPRGCGRSSPTTSDCRTDRRVRRRVDAPAGEPNAGASRARPSPAPWASARSWARVPGSDQTKFRVVLGPLKEAEFQSMLPGGARLKRLAALVRNYVGDELDWDLRLVLDKRVSQPLPPGPRHAARLDDVARPLPRGRGPRRSDLQPASGQHDRCIRLPA